MTTKTLGLAVVALVALTGCDVSPDAANPAVSQFNGDSVSIQLNGTMLEFMAADKRDQSFARADVEAVRICQKGPKKRAEFASTRNIPTGQYTYVVERLYLCLN